MADTFSRLTAKPIRLMHSIVFPRKSRNSLLIAFCTMYLRHGINLQTKHHTLQQYQQKNPANAKGNAQQWHTFESRVKHNQSPEGARRQVANYL